jgi:hypothetical protein
MAIRFGTLIGGAAGIAGAAWMTVAAAHASLEDGSLVLPGMTVLVGMLAGILSQHQGERLAHFRQYAGTLEARQARARRLLAVKDSVIHELQSRIEEQTVSVEAMYRWSRHMSSAEATDMFQALLQLLHADLGVTRAAVYRRATEDFGSRRRSTAAPSPRRSRSGWTRARAPPLRAEHRRRVSLFDAEAAALRSQGRRRPSLRPVCERTRWRRSSWSTRCRSWSSRRVLRALRRAAQLGVRGAEPAGSLPRAVGSRLLRPPHRARTASPT